MDYISRETLKERLKHKYILSDLEHPNPRLYRHTDIMDVVDMIPAADVIERDCATIDGYSVEYLTAVASLAAKNNITPEIAIRQMADIKVMAKVLSEDMKKTLEDALRRAVCTQ